MLKNKTYKITNNVLKIYKNINTNKYFRYTLVRNLESYILSKFNFIIHNIIMNKINKLFMNKTIFCNNVLIFIKNSKSLLLKSQLKQKTILAQESFL